MTGVAREQYVCWLRGVVAAAVGFNLFACAERNLDDFSDGAAEEGTGPAEGETGETGETLPSEPFPCPEKQIIVEGPVLPDGSCGECDDACWEQASMLANISPECPAGCDCDPDVMCSATVHDENGLCLHGFDLIAVTCGEGRPLLAGDEVRVAPACRRSDWTCAVPLLDVPAALRERVLGGWLERAAMEHASVAAFARFTLQLLELGASAELIDAAQVAGRDEARHARLCYGVASKLGDAPVGPGRLDLRGLDLDVDPARVALASILEGCIGETIAAAKMRHLAARVDSPEIAAMLASIAEDEAMHAALAWKALDWMLRNFEIDAVVRETFASALGQASCSRTRPREDAVVRYGVLDEATSAWVAAEVMCEVIAPAAAHLLDVRLAA